MEEKNYNFIIICSDQHNKRVTGCYGNDYVFTPNIDRMASNGVVFDNAYTACPICMPARASLATGQYSFRGRWWDNAHPYNGELDSFGTILHNNGYEVTTIGKLHFKDATENTGFFNQIIPMHATKGGVGEPSQCLRNNTILKPQQRKGLINAGPGDSDYTEYDRKIAQYAIDYLDNKSDGSKNEKPWCLYVGFVNPHPPFKAPREWYDYYLDKLLPFPQQYDLNSRPMHPVLEGIRRFNELQDEFDRETVEKAIRTYYAKTSFLDEQVGKVLDKIEEKGLLSNSIVIYLSDHGENLGSHGLWYKQTMYEESAGIPLVVEGAGIPKGARNKTIVNICDVFPTVLSCFGIDVPQCDGIDLIPYAQGKEDLERYTFSEFHACGAIEDTYMIRKGKYKYIYYHHMPVQLFNLDVDPLEKNDISKTLEGRKVIRELHPLLLQILNPEEIDVDCRTDQQKIVSLFGGENNFSESVLWKTSETPVPKEFLI